MIKSFFQAGHHRSLITLSLLLLFALPSCELSPFRGTPAPATRHQWIEMWLNNPTCQPPCWENITPGETSLVDAGTLLSKNPDVKVTLLSNSTNKQYSQLQWQLENSSDTGIANTDETGNAITSLSLNLGSDQLLTVNEVISTYGQPSHVVFFDCRGEITRSSCIVHIVYPNLGMALELFLQSETGEEYRVKINSDANVENIMLFPEGKNTYSETILQHLNKPRIDWKGFAEYP